MYQYQKTHRFFAQVADDIKALAEAEIQALGAADTAQVYRGIHFAADPKTLYAVNFHSRLINRVLAPLVTFDCHSDRYLHKTAAAIRWEDFLAPSGTFAVFAAVSNSAIRHSKFAALRVKDAVADYFSGRIGKRPSVDTKHPDIWINLYINANRATISVDTSGGSLHRRGYRRASVPAPMVETLAAAIVQHTEWDGRVPLYDPFCGSGTLLCEAYMFARRMPAAILRRTFGFERFPDFDPSLWKRVREEGIRRMTSVPAGLIAGSDVSSEAVAAARTNCAAIDTGNAVALRITDVFDMADIRGKLIVCNPPYGVRLRSDTDLSGFYKRFGDFLKQRCTGSTAYIYFGDRTYIKRLGLKPAWKKALSTGGLDGRLVKYDLY
ncbi:MAG: class I SAM-dependent RNA methyltransferase [Deltaproteobacteria bacterium]|nr:class I SAM-dependent RNA methyltransferase [Deltaproteobacteria bacterium]MBW1820083.1 class I SAM-dependent RNA methyltransferase [Deltaproteobacteria bacterium]